MIAALRWELLVIGALIIIWIAAIIARELGLTRRD